MPIRTRITQIAHERGLTAAEVARRAGLYRSNLSAMDAGRRSASVRLLDRVAEVVGCHPGELLDRGVDAALGNQPILERRERALTDGTERGWTHAVLLAWQRHALSRRGARRRR